MIYSSKATVQVIFFVSIFLSFAVILPAISLASRRGHRYHANSQTKPSVTPTPTGSASADLPVTGENLLLGQWRYLPGASRTDEGLLIQPTELSIVSQDGTDSIPNAPINMAGTYLKNISGDFSITAKLLVPKDTIATVQLYAAPPVIADEFRVETPSIQLTFQNGQIQVKTWNGTKQTASLTKSFPLILDGTTTLMLTRSGDTLQIANDLTPIGSVILPTLFTSGNIWFGFDSANGSWILTGLQADTSNNTIEIGDASKTLITQHNAQGLQALATKKRPGFLVGMAEALGPMTADPAYAGVALDSNMFGSITPENDMKMINLQPIRGTYTFQKADAIVALAKQNGISDIHGHTLVFGEANPMWFNDLPVTTAADKADIEKIMKGHISTVVKHFGDSVNSWDVVNEPIADFDEFDSTHIYRNHKWYQAMGSSYIIKAFDAAYAANPKALLSINEYGLEADGDRWDAFLGLMKDLTAQFKAYNIPQDHISVGFQAHVYEAGDQIDPAVLRDHIKTLGNMGYKVQISENDVYSNDGDQVQADQYAAILNACISEKNCIAWRGWMLSDKYDIWMDGNTIQHGVDGLFDAKLKPRPAFTAMQNILTQ